MGTTNLASGNVSINASMRPQKVGILAQVCAASVGRDLAPDAFLVESHRPTSLLFRPLIDVVEVEITHEREHEDPEPRAQRPRQERVVLFGNEEPGPVHVVGLREPLLLDLVEAPPQPVSEHGRVSPKQQTQQALLQQGREEQLIHQCIAELRIGRHQPVQIGGSAAGVPDAERRRRNTRTAQRREEDRVEREAHGMDSSDRGHTDQECEVALPTRRGRRVPAQQPKHRPVVGPVEVERRAHELSSAPADFRASFKLSTFP